MIQHSKDCCTTFLPILAIGRSDVAPPSPALSLIRRSIMSFVFHTTDAAVSMITLNRPERMNAISIPLLEDLLRAIAQANNNPATRVIVLHGAGRAFCAGDDLKEYAAQSQSQLDAEKMATLVQDVTRALMLGRKPVIGAIHGYAVGAGLEWVLNCDMVVAADTLVGFFPEMALGHFVSGGVTHVLPHVTGHQRAMELLLLGERQDAQTLLRRGLGNRVVPADDTLPAAMEIAQRIVGLSPTAVSRLKKAVTLNLAASLEAALQRETESAIACFTDPDTRARVGNLPQA